MFDEKLQGLIFSLREMADDMALSPHGRRRSFRIREAIELLDSFNTMHAERDQLRGALMMIAESKCPSLVPLMTPEQIARAALSGDSRQPDETGAPPAGWLLQGWQPIAGAPRDGSHILVMDIDDPTITTVVAWGHGGEWKFVTDHGRISHWMPLPPHPRLVDGLERLGQPENSAAVYVQPDGTVSATPPEKAAEKAPDEECSNCHKPRSQHLTDRLICPDAVIVDVFRFAPQVKAVSSCEHDWVTTRQEGVDRCRKCPALRPTPQNGNGDSQC